MMHLASLADLRDRYDIVIIGAGPAGMAAAAEAGGHGLSVLLVDENWGLGGQAYRAIEDLPLRTHPLLGASFARGDRLGAAPGSVRIEISLESPGLVPGPTLQIPAP